MEGLISAIPLVDEPSMPLEEHLVVAGEVLEAAHRGTARAIARGGSRRAARVEREDARGALGDQAPVVRDHQHGARVVGEPLAERRDGLQVEVVRRLVEHEHVVLGAA